jgi:hypothetical protein
MLDEIFQPTIAGNTFSNTITDQKKEAYDLIDNLEITYNSKLVSATKYESYVIALSIIISGASFIWKLNKYKDIIINKIDKKYKNIIISKKIAKKKY